MKGNLIILKANGSVASASLDGPPSLDVLQTAVGGSIETVPYFDKYNGVSCVAFCNEEGKLDGLALNRQATQAWREVTGGRLTHDVLVGDIAIIQGDDDLLRAL
jgi:hypothetical protein